MANSNDQVNRIELMDEKKEGGTVGFHKFMLKFPKNRHTPFCIVEGEDAKYYSVRVKLICSNVTPIFIQCGGKRGVLETYKIIVNREEYAHGKIFYFVDRDFDPLICDKNIYETPCYSIENFYTTDETIRNLVRHVFNIEDTEEDFDRFLALFKARQIEFHEATSLLNAWIMCQRELSLEGKMPRLNLNSFKLKDFIIITLDKVIQNYDLERIENSFSHACKISEEVITNKLALINHLSAQFVYRGKFEVEFLSKLLELIQENLSTQQPVLFQQKRRISLNFYDPISQFSTFAYTPDSLIKYIELLWKKDMISAS